MNSTVWSNEYFRLALDASPSGQIIVDKQGIIRCINNIITAIFGYTEPELLDSPLELLIAPDNRHTHPGSRKQYYARPTVRAIGSGQILFWQHKNGEEIPVEIGLNPLSDVGGTFVLASIVDISDRVKSERRFQLALEGSPSGLILIDENGNIELVFQSRGNIRLFPKRIK